MRHYWTRFLISYPKTIVYMLQSSEYRLKDYFSWLHRSVDMRLIMKRRKLDYTKKARLLLAFIWVKLLAIYLLSLALIIISIYITNYFIIILAVFLLFMSPLIIAYGVSIPLWLGQKLIQEPKSRKIIASAQQIFAKHPALKIAIAGSYGKTTAKEILRTVLGETKRIAFTPGNMNTPIGISRFAQTLNGDEEIIIFELGEEKVGDILELCELVQPEMGIITGINEAHLSSFGAIEKTVATVFELEDYLGQKVLYKSKENLLVAEKISDSDNLAFDRTGVNGWRVSEIKTDISGTSFIAKKDEKMIMAHTGIIGAHNVGIITVVIDIADSLGLSPKQITDGIAKTVPFEHRMQPRNLHGAWIIDDTYNGNTDGIKTGLLLLKELKAVRRIYVTPGLVEQGSKTKKIHQKIGEQIAKVADVVVLVQNSVTDYIFEGLQKAKFNGKLIIIDDPLEFYTNLEHFVANGDVVLMQNDWTDNYA